MILLKPTAAQSLRTSTLSPYAGEPIVNWESYADIWPQACSSDGGDQSSGEGNSSPPSYIYITLGKVRPVFPSLTIEKEFYQVAPPGSPIPPSDELLFQVLSQAENLYLAREMCWVFTIAKVDSYIIKPTSEEQVLTLVAAIRPGTDLLQVPLSTVVGARGPVAPSGACNGLEVPIVPASNLFFSTLKEYIQAIIEALNETSTPQLESDVSEVIGDLWQTAINPGDTEGYRALNFVLTKYLGAYTDAYSNMYPADGDPVYDFVGVESQPALLQGDQQIYNVIFTYQGQTNGRIKRSFCQVDVTTQFPFLFQAMAQYISA